METTKFVDLVERMREAQKNYFRTRAGNYKTQAIILERIVDRKIEEFRLQIPAPPMEGTINFSE